MKIYEGKDVIDFPWFGLAGFITSALWAALLQWKRHWWERDWIWTVLVIVVVGVSYTGLFMYLFVQYGTVPDHFASPRDAMQWVNWYWVYMFLWTGAPMCIWRVGVFASRLRVVGRNAIEVLRHLGDRVHAECEDSGDGD